MDKKRTGESLKDLFKGELGSKGPRREGGKALKRQDPKTPEGKRKHTVYLSPEQSKKLRLYAAQHDMQMSEVIEDLVAKNL